MVARRRVEAYGPDGEIPRDVALARDDRRACPPHERAAGTHCLRHQCLEPAPSRSQGESNERHRVQRRHRGLPDSRPGPAGLRRSSSSSGTSDSRWKAWCWSPTTPTVTSPSPRPVTTWDAKGLEIGGGGVGLVVGLFAPPLLASVVVGAAAGALVGKFARHRVESGLEEKIRTAPPARISRHRFHLRPAASQHRRPRRSPGRWRKWSPRSTAAALRNSRPPSRKRKPAWAADRDEPAIGFRGEALGSVRLFHLHQADAEGGRGDGRGASRPRAATWRWPRSSSPTLATQAG